MLSFADRNGPAPGRDRLRPQWLLARRPEPGRHGGRHAELLLQDQLPHRVAQDGAGAAQAEQEVAPRAAEGGAGAGGDRGPDRPGEGVGPGLGHRLGQLELLLVQQQLLELGQRVRLGTGESLVEKEKEVSYRVLD